MNLQPSDLRLNAYRSPPGGQVFSPCYFSCIYISMYAFNDYFLLFYILHNTSITRKLNTGLSCDLKIIKKSMFDMKSLCRQSNDNLLIYESHK